MECDIFQRAIAHWEEINELGQGILERAILCAIILRRKEIGGLYYSDASVEHVLAMAQCDSVRTLTVSFWLLSVTRILTDILVRRMQV